MCKARVENKTGIHQKFWSTPISVTRLGDFWKLLLSNFLAKVAQLFGPTFWAILKRHFWNKKELWLFGGNFRWKPGYFLAYRLVALNPLSPRLNWFSDRLIFQTQTKKWTLFNIFANYFLYVLGSRFMVDIRSTEWRVDGKKNDCWPKKKKIKFLYIL